MNELPLKLLPQNWKIKVMIFISCTITRYLKKLRYKYLKPLEEWF